jgi:hypothetical protein
MKTRRIVFIILLTFLLQVTCALSKEYYIANKGNDNANGLSPEKSIRTIQKLNELTLRPGDKVFFRSGDYFTGTIRIESSGRDGKPIVFSSYGEGDKPVISGSFIINSFSKEKENLFSANCEKNVRYLFMNGNLLTLARYPDSGYLKMDGGGQDYLEDLDFPLTKRQVEGATVRMRTKNWQWEYRTVIDYSGYTLTFDSILFNKKSHSFVCQKGWGYYLDNKKNFLDSEREWYYAFNEKKIYLYSKHALNEKHLIEGSFLKCGFIISPGVSYVEISNISISGYTEKGIYCLGNNHHIDIRNNEFNQIGQFGIYVEGGSTYIGIKENAIRDIFGKGLELMEVAYSVIERNDMKRIGLVPGYGIDGVNGAIGISVVNREIPHNDPDDLSHHNKIINNYIDSTGYSAVRMDGHHNLCEGNIAKNGLLTLNDGGLFYCWGGVDSNYTFHNVFRNNIIINCVGNADSSTPGHHKINPGIYLDGGSRDIIIENNIVTKAGGAGIFVNQNCFRVTVRKNLCYDNRAGISIADWEMPYKSYGHVVINNILFCVMNLGQTLAVGNNNGTSISPGIINNNTHVSMNERYYISKTLVEDDLKTVKYYALKRWQKEHNLGQNSRYLKPAKNGTDYPFSEIFINESDTIMTIIPDERYQYMNLNKKVISGKISLEPRQAKVLFYRGNN